jgi:threonine dehydrogenase-like Zn-dependent dehydrogenase
MTARRSGVQTESDVMWVPALARGLIREDVLRSMRYCDGYTDLLGPSAPARRSLAQRAMNSPTVAAIYQHIWRPIMVAAMSLHGMSISAERERASAALHLGGRQRVLDVACGPGNFTSFFADQLAADGFVIGLDSSVPMMERAVREMVRVLSPGGRIAVMTTYGRESFLVRKGLELGATICGIRVFDRTTVPTFFAAAGLVDIEQQLRGISQFVVARRPERATELGRWHAR